MIIIHQLDKLGHRNTPIRDAIEKRMDAYLRDLHVAGHFARIANESGFKKAYREYGEALAKYIAAVIEIIERYPTCGKDGDDVVNLIKVAYEEMSIEEWDKAHKNGGGE